MRRRSFVGGAFAGLSVTGGFAAPRQVKAGEVPTTTLGKTGVKVSVIAQGGARMDLHPDVADVRKRAIAGAGVYTGPTMEYWKKKG